MNRAGGLDSAIAAKFLLRPVDLNLFVMSSVLLGPQLMTNLTDNFY